ncbi:MAG TPA: acyltransferase [Bryobacteraceae bacterium]|jgi:acetyltransferase-like isoleucine patch superfamily enzyme|nr:acyltransferase [Bryobacteraceae bacterium]
MPAPRIVVRPALAVFLAFRTTYYFLVRVFVCEPLFKAYCKSYGTNLKTGVFVHWVQGSGDLILGDNVTVDGRCTFAFAARYSDRPTLIIGSNTRIGHSNSFTIGKEIRVGSHCLFAGNVTVFDSSGHPTDPTRRYLGYPSDPDRVRPVVIGDNVWIGSNVIILPGVRIGDNSVVAAGSVVRDEVSANTLVSGNPAQRVRSLVPPDAAQMTRA